MKIEKKEPLFSIVIPVFQTEQYLERCVSSVMEQTFREIEIILVDDGSDDGCPQMCDKYRQQDARICVIHKKNGGLSDARNVGIQVASGQYILFLDSDDYYERTACESLMKATETNCDILIGEGVTDGTQKRLSHASCKPGIYEAKDYLKKMLIAGKMPMASVLYGYRRAFLAEQQLLFSPGILHEDESFTPQAFLKANEVFHTGIVFYHYVCRIDSITMRCDLRRNADDLYATCQQLQKIYCNLPNRRLSRLLRDSLVVKYLSLMQDGKLYQYGKIYLHRWFTITNAYRIKTRIKALLYCASPKGYWRLNDWTKRNN